MTDDQERRVEVTTTQLNCIRCGHHTGPGFTMRPEIPEDRHSYRKPWVNKYKHARPRRGRLWVILVTAPRGRRHDPAPTAAKAAAKRARQSKTRR